MGWTPDQAERRRHGRRLTAPADPRPVRTFLAYATGAFGLSINGQVSLLIPLQARQLGASIDQIGLIVGLGSLVAAALSVSIGSKIDRFGSRVSFIAGTGACAVFSALYILPTTFWWFVLIQPLLGVGRACGWLASQTYVTSMGTEADRSTHAGRFSFCSNLGQLAGPLMVGFAAQAFGLRWALLVPVAYSLLFMGIGLMLSKLPEDVRRSDRGPKAAGFAVAGPLLRLPGTRFVLVVTFARIWVTIVFTTFLPIILVEDGVSTGTIGIVMSVMGLVATVAAAFAGPLVRASSEFVVASASVGCGALALVLTPVLAVMPTVFVLPCLVGIGVGLSLPALMSIVGETAPPGSVGVALGLRSLANQLASTTGPLVVGPLIATLGLVFGFVAAGGLAGTALAGAYLMVASRRGGASPDGT
jgi:DHA1 family multidrug resistance protein-like MFS transporter